jgi:hypothetical protein
MVPSCGNLLAFFYTESITVICSTAVLLLYKKKNNQTLDRSNFYVMIVY